MQMCYTPVQLFDICWEALCCKEGHLSWSSFLLSNIPEPKGLLHHQMLSCDLFGLASVYFHEKPAWKERVNPQWVTFALNVDGFGKDDFVLCLRNDQNYYLMLEKLHILLECCQQVKCNEKSEIGNFRYFRLSLCQMKTTGSNYCRMSLN